ncbi:MAG TPA: DUF2460 domain-containing protein [Terriglobales bacterium]|nr:DUF2460 domain-containing protein [Terriglobales bacterium]
MAATFPTLKSGAVAQYPATKAIRYSTYVVRFLDGSDQRYRQFTPPLRRWTIKLDMLDEAELSALEQFFMAQQGRFETFAFVDPWTQATIASCSLDQDSLEFSLSGEALGATSLVVVENRT